MKNFLTLFLIFGLLSGSVYAINELDSKEIASKYAKDKILKLKIDGIPTSIQKQSGNLGIKQKCEIIVKKDGTWKVKSFLGFKSESSNVLPKGEALKIEKVKVRKKSVLIKTVTLRALAYDNRHSGQVDTIFKAKSSGAGINANNFVFKFDKKWEKEKIMALIDKYFDVFDSVEELNKPKEIKMGMTIEEVESMMGQPVNKAVLGSKVKYKYPDMKITFTDGKVTDVDF